MNDPCSDPGPDTPHGGERRRLAIEVTGRVQGVGFRPFVFNLAEGLDLGGMVGNDDRGVFIEIEGSEGAIETFRQRLENSPPPLARIASITAREIPPRDEREFAIARSTDGAGVDLEITPDTALCDDCLAEMTDPDDRRHGYAFINCTNCGPRYSIIRSVPYDRERTTMASFTMCAACAEEFASPRDRRFHAQPNACALCGPRVWLADEKGAEISGDPFQRCAALLEGGKIVAVKGLGGFHLACRADSDAALRRLRQRKRRAARPFAIMVATLEEAAALAEVDSQGAALLCDRARPIVLLRARKSSALSREVAPGTDRLGIMLPYTPLHALLLDRTESPLVMTSGNPSAEPLCHDNGEALRRLGAMADAFLFHDRPIERPIDDSVVLPPEKAPARDGGGASPKGGEKAQQGFTILRRARGYVPDPIEVGLPARAPILAVGGELKSAVCFLEGRRAVLSEHLGELSNAAAYRNFVRALGRLKELLAIEPAVVACDLHPDYAATRFAHELGLPVVSTQHHHAHVASCMAENGRTDPVIGVACDGTGYGTDGTVWGCEVLLCDLADFDRVGCLAPFCLPGGDRGAVETWRPAAGLLYSTFGDSWLDDASSLGRGTSLFESVDREALHVVSAQVADFRRAPSGQRRVPMTSSLGRLFDAAAFVLGICGYNRFESEGAMALETAARQGRPRGETLGFAVLPAEGGGRLHIDVRPMIRTLLDERRAGRPAADLALAFHDTVAEALATLVVRIAGSRGIDCAALSGGCFANGLLLEKLRAKLARARIEVLLHGQVPPGDGGVALGQAVIAAARQKRS